MKYKIKHPEVDVRRRVERSAPGEKGINCDYEITTADGKVSHVMQSELLEKYAPVGMSEETPKHDQIRKLAQEIIDSEIMVDDSNAEEILHDAVELAHAIKKLL